MARILFTTFGSYGDLYPYFAIGRELLTIGHTVVLATSATYRPKVEAVGLEFAPVRPDMSLDDREMIAYVFDRKKGTERILRAMLERLRDTYDDTEPLVRAADLTVSHPLSLAAVLAAEKWKRPWVSTVLAPISFLSAHDPPAPAQAPWLAKLRVLGPGFMKLLWDKAKQVSLGWLEPVIELRRELGLPPGAHPLFEGSHAPGLVLGLFSEVFANTQPDWPPQAVITGFPFFDANQTDALAPELETFLQAGPPPVLFTLGSSAVAVAGNFYADSLRAIQSLDVRAVILTGAHPQNLPHPMPNGVLAWPYAPHELLMPRAAAIVHQGGIGTTAQAMRAGRPMLVVPFSHDQFDQAVRIERLGLGRAIWRQNYTARSAATAVEALLNQPSYATKARGAGAQVQRETGAATAAQALHNFLQRGAGRS